MGAAPGAGTLWEGSGGPWGVDPAVSASPLASDADPAHVRRSTAAGCLGSGGLTPPVHVPRTRYFLQPRDNGSKSLKPGDLGSLRLNVVYTEDHVFSSDYYSPLRDLLLRSADVEVPAWPPWPCPPPPGTWQPAPTPALSPDLPACLVPRTVCVSLYWGWGPHSPT